MNNEGKFTRGKKMFAIVTGLAIAAISAFNSKNGFVSDSSSGLLELMGWAFSAACMAAQFMFTSEFRKLNWTVIFLGGFAYLYSIPTNYFGLQSWDGVATEHNFVNMIAAIFMDVYPEAAIAWALGESKLGDMIGNLIRTGQRTDELTDTGPRKPIERMNQYRQQNPYQQTTRQTVTHSPVPAPRPNPTPNTNPTYHPVGYQPGSLEDFLNNEER